MRKNQKHTEKSKNAMKGKKTNTQTAHIQVYIGSAERKKKWEDYANEHFKAESSGKGKVSTMIQKFTEYCIQNNISDPSKFKISTNAIEELKELETENTSLKTQVNTLHAQLETAQTDLKIAQMNAKFKQETKTESSDVWVLEDRIMSLLQTTKKAMKISEIIKALDLEKDKEKWVKYEDVTFIENEKEVTQKHEIENLSDIIYGLLMFRLKNLLSRPKQQTSA